MFNKNWSAYSIRKTIQYECSHYVFYLCRAEYLSVEVPPLRALLLLVLHSALIHCNSDTNTRACRVACCSLCIVPAAIYFDCAKREREKKEREGGGMKQVETKAVSGTKNNRSDWHSHKVQAHGRTRRMINAGIKRRRIPRHVMLSECHKTRLTALEADRGRSLSKERERERERAHA